MSGPGQFVGSYVVNRGLTPHLVQWGIRHPRKKERKKERKERYDTMD